MSHFKNILKNRVQISTIEYYDKITCNNIRPFASAYDYYSQSSKNLPFLLNPMLLHCCVRMYKIVVVLRGIV